MSGSSFIARLFLVALAWCISGWSPILAQETDKNAANTESAYATSLEDKTFALINDYRKSQGFPVLIWSSEIAKVARGHSADMATEAVDFGHEGFGKRVTLLKTEMIGLKGAGENVFMANGKSDMETVQLSVTSWLHSPHHLANIRGDFNYSGIGISKSKDGAMYFTQFFVKIVPPAPAPAAAAEPPPKVVSPFTFLADPKTR